MSDDAQEQAGQDQEFFEMADAFIELANQHGDSKAIGKVLWHNMRYVCLNFGPFIPLARPFALVAGQLVSRYAFEPLPDAVAAAAKSPVTSGAAQAASVYSVRINGKSYTVEVAEGGQLSSVQPATAASPTPSAVSGHAVNAVLAGNIFKVHVQTGDSVEKGQPLLVVEAMKMETAVVAPTSGTISGVFVAEGDVVSVGDPLVAIA